MVKLSDDWALIDNRDELLSANFVTHYPAIKGFVHLPCYSNTQRDYNVGGAVWSFDSPMPLILDSVQCGRCKSYLGLKEKFIVGNWE